MTTERIKELQEQTGYPQSISVYKALLQVWNECEQEQLRIDDVVWRSEQLKALLEKLLENSMCSVVGDELIEEALKGF